MSKKIQRLNEELEDKAIDMVLGNYRIYEIAKELGLTRQQFQRYMIYYPEFSVLMDQAYLVNCRTLEDELLDLVDKHGYEEAEVRAKIIQNVLKYRDRKRYGEKVEMDVNHSVDIIGAIEEAKNRIRDVSNVILIGKKSPDLPGD